MKPIDVHTHLSSQEFDSDRAEVVARALEVCDAFIDIGSGTSPDAFAKAEALANSYSRVFFTAGIHPHDATELGNQNEILSAIERSTQHKKCVAVGECGLDNYYEHSNPADQARIFEWHKNLAKKVGLPLMIHTRDAEDETKKILNTFEGQAVFHCFTGTKDLADFGVAKGFFISFSGIVTFKNAEDLRQTFLSLPLESILIETDSPYLAPVPMRGKRNETSLLQYTAKFLAELRGLSLDEFTRKTRDNSLRAFPKMRLS